MVPKHPRQSTVNANQWGLKDSCTFLARESITRLVGQMPKAGGSESWPSNCLTSQYMCTLSRPTIPRASSDTGTPALPISGKTGSGSAFRPTTLTRSRGAVFNKGKRNEIFNHGDRLYRKIRCGGRRRGPRRLRGGDGRGAHGA